jgi:hypothetical protein
VVGGLELTNEKQTNYGVALATGPPASDQHLQPERQRS